MEQIMKAIGDFQKECPVIRKLKEGYGYVYADMEGLYDTIKPLLLKFGLMTTYTMDKENILTLNLRHESGEELHSSIKVQDVLLAKMSLYQSIGSGITYYRRYLICSLLDIVVAGENNDADGCKPDNQKPASTDGRDVRSAYTKKPVTGKQIDNGDLL